MSFEIDLDLGPRSKDGSGIIKLIINRNNSKIYLSEIINIRNSYLK